LVSLPRRKWGRDEKEQGEDSEQQQQLEVVWALMEAWPHPPTRGRYSLRYASMDTNRLVSDSIHLHLQFCTLLHSTAPATCLS